jgi:hypothetical protein
LEQVDVVELAELEGELECGLKVAHLGEARALGPQLAESGPSATPDVPGLCLLSSIFSRGLCKQTKDWGSDRGDKPSEAEGML